MFAPTLRHHGGRFYLIVTNVSDGLGHLLVTADDPARPWSEPIRFPGLVGIDPDLAWDAAGTCYLTYSAYRDHRAIGIAQAIIDPDTGAILEPPAIVWAGTGASYPESPHLYAIEAAWYLLIAEGGTERGHLAAIARAPSPRGPFEPCPHNPILTARSTNAPIQCVGHADLVQRPDGTWAAVHLGTRTRGGNAGWSTLGREVFAREVAWRDGWPVVGDPIEPATPATLVTDDGTRSGALAPVWISPGRHPGELVDPASFTITAPALVARRQQHLHIRVRAVVTGDAALVLAIDPAHRYELERIGDRVRAVACIGGASCVLGERAVAADTVLQLHTEPVRALAPGLSSPGPDVVVLGVVDGDAYHELARLDGRYLSTEVAGGFTGRVVGIAARAAPVRVVQWEYAGRDDT